VATVVVISMVILVASWLPFSGLDATLMGIEMGISMAILLGI